LEPTEPLIERARAGDQAALRELFHRYQGPLRRIAHRHLPARARGMVDTDDIVQSTMIRAFQHLEGYEHRRSGAFLSYLSQILMNRLRDEARKSARTPWQDEISEDLTASARSQSEELIGKEKLFAYESALARLPEEQQWAIRLRIEYGLPFAELAEALEMPSANAVRMMVTRALVRVAREMKSGGWSGAS
jgi:RNA polymerase sigma-70 factor (ECF subfamily)